MVYFRSSLLEEIQNLDINSREKLIQALHWAIAEKEAKIKVFLEDFRSGEELCVSSYDYSELYQGLSA